MQKKETKKRRRLSGSLAARSNGESLRTYNGTSVPTKDIHVIREKLVSKLPEGHKQRVKVIKMMQHSKENIKAIRRARRTLELKEIYHELLIFITEVFSIEGLCRIKDWKPMFITESSQEVSMLYETT